MIFFPYFLLLLSLCFPLRLFQSYQSFRRQMGTFHFASHVYSCKLSVASIFVQFCSCCHSTSQYMSLIPSTSFTHQISSLFFIAFVYISRNISLHFDIGREGPFHSLISPRSLPSPGFRQGFLCLCYYVNMSYLLVVSVLNHHYPSYFVDYESLWIT